jgi:hypothetical protein
VFANGQWVTYRVRGGPTQADGLFAETTKTPYTDEIQLQHEIDLGRDMSLSSVFYWRQTKNIFEDFDPHLYTEPSVYPGPVDDPNTLFLGYPYFGFTGDPGANFILGTLPGSERKYKGLEFAFRKRFSSNWQSLLSYNWLGAEGNAISDGNADFVGDVIFLDPRAPNMFGTVPGTIHHLFKAAGSYTTRWGVELGGTYRWNSGTVVNKTFFATSRHLPNRVPVGQNFTYAGINTRWTAPDSIGGVENPSWGSFDLRIQYVRPIARLTTEFFVDVFNLFDDQAAMRVQDLVAGSGGTPFLGDVLWVMPRRAFLGARVRF